MGASRTATESRLVELTEQLLVKDVAKHEAALEALAEEGDERVVPHLVEILYLDTVANDWDKYGFPETFRRKDPPTPLTHPEVEWPGVIETLSAVAEPNYDRRETAWLKWETWVTQNEIEPLDGFMDWKVRFYRSYHPLVGHMLDVSPTIDDFHRIRWGSCDRSTLHPLNGPEFVPADETDYVEDDDVVYGFEIGDEAYAVPRFIHFPHEMLNAELNGVPVCLSLCTMCNSPILYDRRVGDTTYQFGSTGLIWHGNKAMYDEETHSLWNQQTGRPIAGDLYAAGDVSLEFLPITQTSWEEWVTEHPDTWLVSPDTGYDYDYEYYRDYDGFIKRHYWDNEDAHHPGVSDDEGYPGKEYVYGVDTDDDLRVYPVDAVRENQPVVDTVDDSDVVVVMHSDDVAVYEAPSLPATREGEELVDADDKRWKITHDGLRSDGETLDRIAGRHGLWLSFRPHYDEYSFVTGEE